MKTNSGNPNWKKGVSGNPNGRPRNAEPDLLREALTKEGEKRGEDFWAKVAQYAFTDKNVLIAVLKKFVPDSSNIKLDGEIKGEFTIMPAIEKDNKPMEHKVGS